MSDEQNRIVVTQDGPYEVHGDVKLVRKRQISSEHGEPMTWLTEAEVDTSDRTYVTLCRCGQSSDKPFCDWTHGIEGFDGTETAAGNTFEERREIHEGSSGIVIKRDYSICAEAGYCGHRLANIRKLAKQTDDSIVRAQVMAMVERCPSGSYTYALAEDEPDIEPDLPVQIALVTEMTSEGPIQGPLWVTGNIPIERSDGQPMETRNRVTLCRCGQSANKPLCDGTHRSLGIKETG